MKSTVFLAAALMAGGATLRTAVDVSAQLAAAQPQQAPTLSAAPPVVCVASDLPSWRTAVKLSWTRDVVICLNGTIEWSGNPWDYRLGAVGRSVELVGGSIDLSGYKSTWPAAYDNNGMVFTGARATLRGVTVRGYEGTGSAVRADVSDSLEVYDCTLSDIGTRVLTMDPLRPGYTNGIGCFSMPRRIVVMGCTFSRVALNDEQLSHVLYVQARGEIVCTGNRYYGCGSVWGCYSPRTVIVGEYVNAGGTPDVYNRWTQQMQHPWLLVHNGGALTFAGNTIDGTVDHVFHGRKPVGATMGANVYRCTARTWAFEWGVGDVAREAWAAVGIGQ